MSNEYELARDSRKDLIFTKEQLLAPLLEGMERPPHDMHLGDTEKDYYLGSLLNPGTSAGAEHNPGHAHEPVVETAQGQQYGEGRK
jgi:NADH-quinone oxidoreductase subunit I